MSTFSLTHKTLMKIGIIWVSVPKIFTVVFHQASCFNQMQTHKKKHYFALFVIFYKLVKFVTSIFSLLFYVRKKIKSPVNSGFDTREHSTLGRASE